MSHPGQKARKAVALPSLESKLTEEERGRLDTAIGESVISSGADMLPPPSNVPSGLSYTPAMASAPVDANPYAMGALPQLALDDIISSVRPGNPMEAASMMQLRQQVDAAKQQAAAAPVVTADAKLMDRGRTFHVPASVRDIPNQLCQNQPDVALARWLMITQGLDDETADALADLAAQKGFGQKPLMWFSEQLFWLLQVQRWTPGKHAATTSFSPDDANPNSQSYILLNDTFGPDGTMVLLNIAERLDIGLVDLLSLAAERLLELRDAQVAKNATNQTAASWKRRKPEGE